VSQGGSIGKQAWVSQLGAGPLVLMRRSLLTSWAGGAPTKIPTDLERARAIREIGAIPVGIGSALVLSGRSVPTTWIPGPTGGMLVRWITAQTEEEVLRAAASSVDSTWTPTGARFKTRAGDHVLFHAGLTGLDVDQENLPIKLMSGTYDVTSAMVGEHPVSVFVYRLTWRPEKAR
jgi:Immunity protein 21